MPLLDLSQLPGAGGLGWLSGATGFPVGASDAPAPDYVDPLEAELKRRKIAELSGLGRGAPTVASTGGPSRSLMDDATWGAGARGPQPMGPNDPRWSTGTDALSFPGSPVPGMPAAPFGSLAPDMGGPASGGAPGPFAGPSVGPFNVGPGDPFKVADPMWGPSAPNMGLPQEAMLPPNAQPASAALPGAPTDLRPLTPPAPRASMSGAAPTGSLLDRIGSGINNNADLLLALGAGFAGAGSLGEGMHRAFTNAAPLAGKNQTVDALVAKGLPVEMARAAASNPAIMQQLLPSLFGPKQLKFTEIQVDPFGRKQMGYVDEVNKKTYDLAGNPINADAGGGGGFGDMLAHGVTKVDTNLQGTDYLNQFSPELKAAVKNYVNGDTMPTGNPRMTSMANYAKMIAQKIGPELGIDVSDAKYQERSTMRKQLTNTSPGSMGGQLNFAGTSLAHLADVAEKTVDLGNSNGLGIAPLASLVNRTRQLTTEQAAKANAVSGAVQHYGQEVTKFYAGSPGGEGERTRFLKTMDTAKSNLEIANAIRTERDLIPGRVEQLHGQINDTLGAGEADHRVARTGIPKQVERINAAIAKLDPDGPEAKMMAGQAVPAAQPAQPAQAAPPAPGNYMYDPATGTMKPR